MSIVAAALNFAAAVLFAVMLSSPVQGSDPVMVSGTTVGLEAFSGVVYLGTGIWSLVTRRTFAGGPMVLTLVFNGLALLLGLVGIVLAISTNASPQFLGLIMDAFLIQRAILVLRVRATAR